jgi:hypothetical protein
MSGDGTTGLDVKVNNESRVTMNSSELSIKNADGDIAKVDFSTTSAANVVFYKPILIEEDATLTVASETTFTGDITISGSGITIGESDKDIVIEGPEEVNYFINNSTNEEFPDYGNIGAIRIHRPIFSNLPVRAGRFYTTDSGPGFFARNISYGSTAAPNTSTDLLDGDIYIQIS